MKKILVLLALCLISTTGFAGKYFERSTPWNTQGGAVIKGYDVVSYFTEGTAVKGEPKHAAKWDGVIFHFSSKENRNLFLKNPSKYAPQFGGYCSYAVSKNSTAPVDPVNAWEIINGKLYLNFNKNIHAQWSKKSAKFIAQAEKNWPKLKKKNGWRLSGKVYDAAKPFADNKKLDKVRQKLEGIIFDN